jgi:hypothetical protein
VDERYDLRADPLETKNLIGETTESVELTGLKSERKRRLEESC